MASKVDIWNLALVNLSQQPSIAGPNEDSAEANLCRNVYDQARQETLASHDWGFASRRVTLAVIDDDRERDDWTYQYAYPSDCLQARAIVNSSRFDYPIPFTVRVLPSTGLAGSVDKKVIWTDQQDAVLQYTYNQDDPTFFSPSFVTCLSWNISKWIAKPLTGKESSRDAAEQKFLFYLGVARASNMNEGREIKQSDARNPFTDAHS